MAPIIAFLLAIGVIFSGSESTAELEAQYRTEFEAAQSENIIITDLEGM